MLLINVWTCGMYTGEMGSENISFDSDGSVRVDLIGLALLKMWECR